MSEIPRSSRIRLGTIRLRQLRALPRRIFSRKRPLTALVTGPNGKTTTTNMVAKILQEAGHTVGRCTTEGIFVGSRTVWRGDSSGYRGAGWILTEKGVTAAALEAARGDLINRGLFLKTADVAALTNIAREHIGERGIDTPEHMANLKKRVLDAAQRAVVLNADDAQCRRLATNYPVSKTILFSLDASSASVAEHVQAGGRAVCLRGGPLDGSIIALQGDTGEEIITIKDMPSAHGGLLEVNIANAMAATGLAIGLEIGKDAIASALRRFGLDPADNPGRMSRLTTTTGEIVVNYASNPVAVMTTLPAIDALTHIGTRFCIVTAPDNRPDDHFNAMAEVLHGHFDWYIMFEIGKFIRRRTPGWVPQTIAGHFRDLGVPADRIMTPGDLKSAMQRVFEMTQAGDLVVILGATMYEVEETMAGLGMSPDGTVRRKR